MAIFFWLLFLSLTVLSHLSQQVLQPAGHLPGAEWRTGTVPADAAAAHICASRSGSGHRSTIVAALAAASCSGNTPELSQHPQQPVAAHTAATTRGRALIVSIYQSLECAQRVTPLSTRCSRSSSYTHVAAAYWGHKHQASCIYLDATDQHGTTLLPTLPFHPVAPPHPPPPI